MQTIKNLNQVKGGGYILRMSQESPEVQKEIAKLFAEDKATFLLLYGENLSVSDTTSSLELVYT